MRLILLVSISLVFSLESYAQNVSRVRYAIATYESEEGESSQDNRPQTPAKRSVLEVVEQIQNINFDLFFTTQKSYYESVVRVFDDNIASNTAQIISKYDLKYYFDGQSGATYQNDSFSRKYYVQDNSIQQWQITNETKFIGGYKCTKATYNHELLTMSRFDPEKSVLRPLTATAWFTREIPVPFGPSNQNGLPGLILESSTNGKMYLIATEIELETIFDNSVVDLNDKFEIIEN